jgi:glycine/D-amino acid oxidase-like deaminating enzyme
VKSWDAIIIGAGIIGLALAIELNKQGLRVLVVEKGVLGRRWHALRFPGRDSTRAAGIGDGERADVSRVRA